MKSMMLILLCLTFNVFAEDKAKDDMMKKWQEYSTPSETHKFFATMEGDWTYTQKMWEGKDSKPQESTGTASMKMILGGRYLQQEVKGTVMDQPYEGMGLSGFDNLKKKTVSTWADNMGTSILHGSGTIDLKKKTVSEAGEFTCPMTENNSATYRSQWVVNDKNTMTFTMFRTDEKAEVKMMEMTYKRAK